MLRDEYTEIISSICTTHVLVFKNTSTRHVVFWLFRPVQNLDSCCTPLARLAIISWNASGVSGFERQRDMCSETCSPRQRRGRISIN